MAVWMKAGLWVAALVLPGGLLLLPLIYAVHKRERREEQESTTASQPV